MSAAAENMVGEHPSLVKKFASKYSIDPKVLLNTLKQTAFKSDQEVSNEQMVALLVVADQYSLNPFTKEIYAYPDKHKGIVPVVSIDGWVRIINEHPDYNGYDVILPAEMVKSEKGEHPPAWPWITIKMHRKRVEFTPELTEYFDECYKPPYKPRGKDYFIDSPWQTHPKRFLRHKALIQAARVVFGFAGIYDEDEAQRILESTVVSTQGAGSGAASGGRTTAAKDALKAQLEDKRGTGGVQGHIEAELKKVRDVRDAVTADREQGTWNESQRGGGEQSKARELDAVVSNLQNQQKQEPAKKQPEFQYDVASALEYLRMQKTLDGLKGAYKQIEDDYDFSARDLPIDVEAVYRELKEMMEERIKRESP